MKMLKEQLIKEIIHIHSKLGLNQVRLVWNFISFFYFLFFHINYFYFREVTIFFSFVEIESLKRRIEISKL